MYRGCISLAIGGLLLLPAAGAQPQEDVKLEVIKAKDFAKRLEAFRGKVVLLERGSKLVGETRGEVQNGAARVVVLWTEARTPTGVLVPLDSPGTDELTR